MTLELYFYAVIYIAKGSHPITDNIFNVNRQFHSADICAHSNLLTQSKIYNFTDLSMWVMNPCGYIIKYSIEIHKHLHLQRTLKT